MFEKDYKIPSKSNYTKWSQGENTIRILSNPIKGYEWWIDGKTSDGKEIRMPKRTPMDVEIPLEQVPDPEAIKHFWAFIVWNYDENMLQIMEITQKGIQKAILSLDRSKGWGDPKNYDLSITKEGEGMETKYFVNPLPPKTLDKSIKEKYEASSIKLEALFKGEDPFKGKEDVDPDDIKL